MEYEAAMISLPPFLSAFPGRSGVNAIAYKDSLDNCALPTLCQHFGEGPSLSQHDCARVYKDSTIKAWFDQFGS